MCVRNPAALPCLPRSRPISPPEITARAKSIEITADEHTGELVSIKADGKEFVVSFDVKNTGKVAGAEVAQVYVGDDKCSLVRPAKELKGFDKVYLKAGETKRVSVRLDDEAFRFFDPIQRKFVVEPGDFTIKVGASSADIRLTGKLTVK